MFAHLAATPVQLLGYAASLAVLVTFCMNTMLPLRIAALASNVLFISYGWLDAIPPVMILHIILLPVNVWRLMLVLRLVGPGSSDPQHFDFGLLRPYVTGKRLPAEEVLFHRGDPADAMYIIVSGELVVREIGASRGPGAIIGEMGILSRTRSRTATVLARTDCVLWRLAAVKARQLWFQHPAFALHLAEVLVDRLIDDLGPRSPEGGIAPTPA